MRKYDSEVERQDREYAFVRFEGKRGSAAIIALLRKNMEGDREYTYPKIGQRFGINPTTLFKLKRRLKEEGAL